MDTPAETPAEVTTAVPESKGLIKSEDWVAVILGALVLGLTLLGTFASRPPDFADRVQAVEKFRSQVKERKAAGDLDTEAKKQVEKDEKKLVGGLHANPMKPYVAEVGEWNTDPMDAFFIKEKSSSKTPKSDDAKSDSKGAAIDRGKPIAVGLAGVFVISLVVFGLGTLLRGDNIIQFIPAFIVVFLLATLSFVLAGQNVIKYYNLEYAIWALMTGMIISNTIGTPKFLFPAIKTELYIKTGLILLGAEVLLSRLLALGLPGICVSWVVTPITLITTYLFGQYVLRIPSRSLNMVISADMSVCGVSAAIATAAACKAKKEELSLAIGISLAFTAVMMVIMPMAIRYVQMNDVIAGAWLGGTIDSTGAVAAAGGMIGDKALQVAVTIKMIQNILIGVVAFGVAVYWVTFIERESTDKGPRPGVNEIWLRFPKFVLGFVAASAVFSMLYSGTGGMALVEATTATTGKVLRSWFFCLAFVSIGLETNFRELSHYLKDGKAITLYVCGQTLNLILTLSMAWLMFEVVFKQAGSAISHS